MSSLLVIAVMLLVVGLALAVLEVLVPSGGLIALLSALSLVSGIVCAWIHAPVWGLGTLIATMVLVPVVIVAGFRVLPHTAIGQRMILSVPEPGDAASADHGTDNPRAGQDGQIPIGDEGYAGTDLRPIGTGRFGDQRISVVTEGEWIDDGTAIRVVQVEGNRIVVEAVS